MCLEDTRVLPSEEKMRRLNEGKGGAMKGRVRGGIRGV